MRNTHRKYKSGPFLMEKNSTGVWGWSCREQAVGATGKGWGTEVSATARDKGRHGGVTVCDMAGTAGGGALWARS